MGTVKLLFIKMEYPIIPSDLFNLTLKAINSSSHENF